MRSVTPALFPLAAAAVAFLAAQGFGRFGFGLVLPAMRDALRLSDGDMGLLAGIGLSAYLVASAPAGALATRFGTRRVVVGGLLGTAAGLAGTGLANGFLGAAIGQAIAGASGPAAIVPVLAIASRWVAPAFRGRATGLVVGGGGIGLLLAGLLVPLLLTPGDPTAWRRAWWGLAAGVLIAAAFAALLLRDPPVVAERTTPAPVSQVYRLPAVWRLALVFGLDGISYIVYGTFFAAHLQRHGLDPTTVGRLWSLAGLLAVGSGFLGGGMADRLGPSTALVVMFILQAAGLGLLAFGDSIGWYTLSAVLYGISLWGFPSAVSKAATEIVGPSLAPAALGLLVTAFALGQASGPVVAGLLAGYFGSLAPGLLFGAIADIVGAVAAFQLRHDEAKGYREHDTGHRAGSR
jgi:predicted MFS family arabinose efflux permease